MERLTIPDVKVDEHTTRRTIIDASAVRERAMEIYWRLKEYEDLGFAPELRIGFRRKQDFMDYAEIFCCDKYTECPVFKAILQGRGERV